MWEGWTEGEFPGTRVLVVDDDPVARDLMRIVLESLDAEVECVVDGNAAMARLEGEPPDLVLLDVRLPYESGLNVLRRLRRLPGWCDTPVIVVTASDTEEILLLALEVAEALVVVGGVDPPTRPQDEAGLVHDPQHGVGLLEGDDDRVLAAGVGGRQGVEHHLQ